MDRNTKVHHYSRLEQHHKETILPRLKKVNATDRHLCFYFKFQISKHSVSQLTVVALIVFSATFSKAHKYMFCHHAAKVSQAKRVKTLKNIARIAILMQNIFNILQ